MRILIASMAFAALSLGASAQEAASPEGTWQDEFGTVLEISMCGDGTALCATLIDVQGKSRTEANLAYVNQRIVEVQMTEPNKWSGTVIYDGNEAQGNVTQTGPDTIEIQGCRVVILCQTLVFNRIS